MMKSLHIDAFTDRGPVRETNEDHLLVGRFVKNHGFISVVLAQDDDWLARYGLLCAVADGVGGEAGGAIASLRALHALEGHFYSSERGGSGEMDAECSKSLEVASMCANEALLTIQGRQPELARMGCTLAGVCVTPTGYVVFSAGDSRVYRVRDGVARVLTVDDTLANVQKYEGLIDEEAGAKSADRHTLTNLLGSRHFRLHLETKNEFRDGDGILICSDGIHDLIPHEQIEQCLNGGNYSQADLQALCDAAIAAGGRDNLSAILIELAS
jgi:serine/threonine protein phosphatase PrpC